MIRNDRPSKIQSLVISFLLLLALGCTSDSLTPSPSNERYFPLRVGDYRVYLIEETRITPFNVEEQFSYEIKTLVTDSFQNASGNFSYILSRYKRTAPDENWAALDTWVARTNESEVVVNEGNIPFVKISFPVQADRSWNGNAYNSEESIEFCEGDEFTSCDLYSFGEIKKTFETTAGLPFDNTIEVIENNSPDIFIRHDVRKSIYSWDVGLVYRESTVLQYCTVGECYGNQLVEDGLIFKQELIEYGHQ